MYILSIYKNDKFVKEEDIGLKNLISVGRHHLNDINLPDLSCKISRFHVAFFYDSEKGFFFRTLVVVIIHILMVRRRITGKSMKVMK